ncbi:MAG: hypothetical protein IIY23_00385 [Erysipelotrichaceae bacterium]|nr:hypothetical protein [Erysipelotrichaceae bacterium]
MLEIEVTRLIAAAVAAFLLGYACYVAAYVKHKNEIRDEINKMSLAAKNAGQEPSVSVGQEVRVEKTQTWYFGYRLALIGLIIVSTAVGWAVGWAVGQDHVLTWVEDAALAAAGAVIGGFVLDKYIIHPIADGSFFEKVEDPIVQRFLQDGMPVVENQVKEKKLSFLQRRKEKKASKKAAKIGPVEEAPVIVTGDVSPSIENLSFNEKVKLIERLRKSL